MEVRRPSWLLVPLMQYVWTVGEATSVIHREVSQKREHGKGTHGTQEIKGGPKEYKMFKSFYKSLPMSMFEKLCFGDQKIGIIIIMTSIYCMLTICQTWCSMHTQ